MTSVKPLWLVGLGPMAQDYAKVLTALGCSYEAIGRGCNSALAFERATGRSAWQGGVELALSAYGAPEAAIVAVGVDQLFSVSTILIEKGVRRLLLEKPGGLCFEELSRLNEVAISFGAEILVAYNRRFYNSVRRAKEFIVEDGGVLSLRYEFTEWAHKIAPLDKPREVKERWMLANSTHVVDLAFHLGGKPLNWRCWQAGSLDWHKSAARFCGAGVTESGALFSYLSDWEAPGRWAVEVMTARRRLVFSPMEELQVIKLGSIHSERVEDADSLDEQFKPGLYRQTEAFLNRDNQLFCKLSDQLVNLQIYFKMAGYN